MIITETIVIHDTEYLHTYSDLGYQLERDGIMYGDAIDPIDSGRTYTEVVVNNEDITAEDFLRLVEEEL